MVAKIYRWTIINSIIIYLTLALFQYLPIYIIFQVISSLKRALQPSVTDLEVNFDVTSGFDALEAPDKLPTIFNGDKTVIYGIFRSKAASDQPLEAGVSGTATLKGKVLGVSFEHTIPFEIPAHSDSPDSDSFPMPIVHHLAAKSLIRDWEHKEGWASTAPESECKKEIIRVSIESSVVSAHTAYIAVDEDQDKPIEGAIQTWDLSAMMAASEGGWGYGGMAVKSAKNKKKGAAPRYLVQKARGKAGGIPLASARLKRSGAAPPPPRSDYNCEGLFKSMPMMKLESAMERGPATARPKSSGGSASDDLTQLISIQLAEGFWSLDKVSSFMKKTISCPIPGVDPIIWATIIALVLLESRFSQQQDEWELVAMKAETWLSMQRLPAGFDVQKLKEEAKKLV